MLGAITGDIVGSVFERAPVKTTDVAIYAYGSCFTDDTVMTVAVADWLCGGREQPLVDRLKFWYRRHPHVGYGKTFAKWANHPTDRDPYGSYGNGSAMRVSPVAWVATSLQQALDLAEETAVVTHDHPEAVIGAKVTAGAIYLARTGADKATIAAFVRGLGYKLDRTLEQIRPRYAFDVSCAGSVPEAITAFLEADSFEAALRNAISLGGDADTQACIAGAIAEPFFGGLPAWMRQETARRLAQDLATIVAAFTIAYPPPGGPLLELPDRDSAT